MRIAAKVSSIREAMQREEAVLAKAVTAGMGDATEALKQGLRTQVRAAGLGDRLANTWRARTYPERKTSLHPTAYAWSKAPEIISFYATGGNIVPINGHKYLAIPTAAVPRSGKRGNGRLTVSQVEAKLGKIMIIKGKGGHLLGLYDASKSRTGKRFKGGKRDLVLLYTFVPQVKGTKRFDVPALVNQIGSKVPSMIAARLK